jgi:uncharacterized repeat protein (TIGR01451 family)
VVESSRPGIPRLVPAFVLMLVFLGSSLSAQTVHCVPDTSPGGCDDSHATIQAAIDHAVSGDTVRVAAGTFAENLTIDVPLTLEGAQSGVDARGRVAAETIVAPPSGVALTLVTGSAGTTIDGLTFSGGTRGIESASGPIDDLTIVNDRFVSFTDAAIFLNDSGSDITIQFSSMDGSGKTGSGGIVHLDTDAFDGFQFLDNEVLNGADATGLFVDGNHNVGTSDGRSPLIARNLFRNNDTGVNLGSRSFEFGSIEDNTFDANEFDGLQGGIQNSAITGNVFSGNGRSGLALTSFGNTAADRGAQNTAVTCNAFFGNGTQGIFLSATQAVGTIATNTINDNNIFGNPGAGLTYSGTETINAEDNYWGSSTGPVHNGNPGGSGDEINPPDAPVDYVPFATAPVECVPAAGQPSPDLGITKTADTTTPMVGSNVTFTITVTNSGLGDAAGVEVTDVLAPELSYESSSATQGTYDPGTGVWTVGTIPAGGSATLTLVAHVNSAPQGTAVSNTATITAPTDGTPGDNASTVALVIAAPVPLASGAGLLLLACALGLAALFALRRS